MVCYWIHWIFLSHSHSLLTNYTKAWQMHFWTVLNVKVSQINWQVVVPCPSQHYCEGLGRNSSQARLSNEKQKVTTIDKVSLMKELLQVIINNLHTPVTMGVMLQLYCSKCFLWSWFWNTVFSSLWICFSCCQDHWFRRMNEN